MMEKLKGYEAIEESEKDEEVEEVTENENVEIP